MSLQDQKYCTLSWLVGEELASDIVRGNDILTIEAIPSDKNFPEDLSKNVNILIKYYCQDEAYNKILQHENKKQIFEMWNKGTNGNNNLTCKMCLKWYHFQCIERKQNPSDLWFCRKCKINVNNSKSTYCY